ncbi:hypothetical protein BDZ89DRAFT_1141630 [Hymenopellis radicata]|nr:hypothetical protein BDZ89DRAFT_1141630 [Hymenopellis radicata]
MYCVYDSFGAVGFPLDRLIELPARREAIFFDFMIVYTMHALPVMIVEIKHPDDEGYNKAGLRVQADERMRRQFDATFDECPLAHLWGLSLIGTSLRVYRGDVATRNIEPGYPSPGHEEELEGAWSMDLLSLEGFNKMKEITGDIKVEMNAAALLG